MTIMNKWIAIGESKNWKQLGNHLFVINSDMVSVYEGVTYDRFAMEAVKDLNVTFLITKNDTWNTVADRFFGKPKGPRLHESDKGCKLLSN